MRASVILSVLLLSGLYSCAPKVYYQVFETEPVSENIDRQANALVSENEDCAVYYNFWGEEGDMGFRIENKTDEPLFVDMGNSYFVLNGTARDYFKNRVFSSSSGSSVSGSKTASSTRSLTGVDYAGWLLTGSLSAHTSTALSNSESYTVSIPEQQIICIPARTSKRIAEFSIYEWKVRDCDLLLYPKRKEISRIQFAEENSPVVFENRLVYRLADGPKENMEHRFFVSKISNMGKYQLIESRKETFCGEESMLEKEFFKETSPNKFYIKYEKGNESWEH